MKIFTDYRHREPDAVGKLYPGVKETLRKLENKRLAVISNGQKELADRILNVLGIDRYFDPVLGGDSPDCRKPSPCPLLNTIEKLGFSPQKTLMVGDMTVDLEAGKEAGTATAAALYGYGEREELERLDPDYLLEEITDLIGIVGG